MEQLVEERAARGPFRDLDDFAGAGRSAPAQPPPDREPRRRRRLRRIARAARRSSPPPRPSSPPPPAPPMRATAARAACSARAPPTSCRSACRRSDELDPGAAHGRREGERSASISRPIRSTATATSSTRTGAQSFAELAALPAPADGGRSGAVMAALVEEARWRTSARGRRYMMATMSDASGQFVATVFDDDVAEQVEQCGQVRRLRAAQRRARPPPGRGGAAGDDPLAPVVREPVQAQPPPDRGRGRRTRTRCAASPPRSPASMAAAGELRAQG